MPAHDSLVALLLAMPADGSWMCGSGKHSAMLNTLLDETSSLVEEDVIPEDGPDAPWMVRLTAAGLAMRAALLAAQVKPHRQTNE